MKGNTNMGNITIHLDDETIDKIGAAIAEHLNVNVAVAGDGEKAASEKPTAKKTAAKKAVKAPANKSSKKSEPEPEEDRESELRAMKVGDLRKIVVKFGYDKDEVKDADLDTLIETILEEEAEAADEPDEDGEGDEGDEDGEDEGEGEDYTREDLEAMSLRELKALAKDWEVEFEKGIDQDDLIDLMLGDGEDDDDDAEDGDEDEYTEEDLMDMEVADLRELAKEWEIEIPKGTRAKAKIVALLMAE